MTYQGGICSEGVDVPQYYRLNRTLNALNTGIFSFRAAYLFCSISPVQISLTPTQISVFYTMIWEEDQPIPCQTRLSVQCDVCGPQSTATIAHQTEIPALGGTRFQMALCHCPWCVTAIARTRSNFTSTNSGCVVSLGYNVGHKLLKGWCAVSDCLV